MGVRILRLHRTAAGDRVALVRYAAGQEHPTHAHDFPTVSLILAGAVWEEVGQVRVLASPLHMVVKPRGTPHANRFGPGGALLLQLAPSLDTVREAAESERWFDAWGWHRAMALAPLVALARALLDRDTPAACDEATDEAFAAAAPTTMANTEPVPRWLEQVRARLECESGSVVALSALASEHGVHRVHLGREFRRHFGVTPSEYRARTRLARVTRLLAGTPVERASAASLAEAAHAAGFADQAHLTREFGRWMGITPGAYRALVA